MVTIPDLSSLTDPNLVRVLGVCYSNEGGSEGGKGPVSMVCEYTEEGDLFQFLQVGSVIKLLT